MTVFGSAGTQQEICQQPIACGSNGVQFNITSRHVERLLVGGIKHRAIARNRSGQYRILWSRSKSNLPSAVDNVEFTKKCQQKGNEDSDLHLRSFRAKSASQEYRRISQNKRISRAFLNSLVCDTPIWINLTPGPILKDSKQDGVASCLFK